MSINLHKTPLKILICGPQKVGKSIIANSLSEFSQVVSQDYHPTIACRILELEKQFTDEQIKSIPILKNNKLSKVKIEIWDVSGDRKFQSTWPAIQYGAHACIVVIDALNNRYNDVLDDWMNGFCNGLDKNKIICFSYKKNDAQGSVLKKTSNQFPSLVIAEVTNNMDSLLPHFNKLINKILLELK
jgi:Rab-like protein 5